MHRDCTTSRCARSSTSTSQYTCRTSTSTERLTACGHSGAYLQYETSSSRKAVSRGAWSQTASGAPAASREPLSPSFRNEGSTCTSLRHRCDREKGEGHRLVLLQTRNHCGLNVLHLLTVVAGEPPTYARPKDMYTLRNTRDRKYHTQLEQIGFDEILKQ